MVPCASAVRAGLVQVPTPRYSCLVHARQVLTFSLTRSPHFLVSAVAHYAFSTTTSAVIPKVFQPIAFSLAPRLLDFVASHPTFFHYIRFAFGPPFWQTQLASGLLAAVTFDRLASGMVGRLVSVPGLWGVQEAAAEAAEAAEAVVGALAVCSSTVPST